MINNPLYDLIRTVTTTPGSSDGGSFVTSAGSSALADALAGNASQLDQLRGLFQAQIVATDANTQKLSASAASAGASSSGGTSAGDVARGVASAMTGGFIFNPIVAGLMQLFGGSGESTTAAPLEKFALPAPVSVEAGFSNAVPGLSPADYGANGLPRVAGPNGQTINVHVNAMDSKSFLDRSEDIAAAVRRALLESSSLNDVIAEL